ncbi:hypothetical protein HZA76_05005 [Candidatus Roizmanbacteria bacterium]|nr:hypothetical protein [Candidatus Roizmanbacteria bacterium]
MAKKEKDFFGARITLYLFIFIFFWWSYLQIFKTDDFSVQNQIFGGTYWLLALCGGLSGLYISRKWGGLGSVMGKAITFLSFGLLGQVFGQVSYSLYTFFFKVEIPYPSFGDIGFISSLIFYIIGLLYLAKATGAILSLKNVSKIFLALLIPLVMLTLSYFLFLKGYEFDWTNPLKVILDFGYPLGETIYISLALLIFILSRGILGGIMKSKIVLILFAFFIYFLADYSFLYFSYYGSLHPAGWNDIVYAFAYYFMSISLFELLNVYYEIKKLQ